MPLQSPGVNTIQQLRSFRASQRRIAWEEDSVPFFGTSESHFQRGARRCLGRKFEAINRDCTVYMKTKISSSLLIWKGVKASNFGKLLAAVMLSVSCSNDVLQTSPNRKKHRWHMPHDTTALSSCPSTSKQRAACRPFALLPRHNESLHCLTMPDWPNWSYYWSPRFQGQTIALTNWLNGRQRPDKTQSCLEIHRFVGFILSQSWQPNMSVCIYTLAYITITINIYIYN